MKIVTDADGFLVNDEITTDPNRFLAENFSKIILARAKETSPLAAISGIKMALGYLLHTQFSAFTNTGVHDTFTALTKSLEQFLSSSDSSDFSLTTWKRKP